MKKILLFIALISIAITQAQIVNIPDTNFKNALLSASSSNNIAQDNNYNFITIDTNADGEIQVSEAQNVFSLFIISSYISDLTGIEAFTNLTYLNCFDNQLSSLDISNNTNLTDLYCDLNQLSSLDISTNLTSLNCSNNQLSSLDIYYNTNLDYLNCHNNQLSSLDISNNTYLSYLICSSNQLSSLDISNNTHLTYLDRSSNQLSSLDISNNTNLTELNCSNNQLSSLDISNNTKLISLFCGYNQLSSLDISNNANLTSLSCFNNQLSSLDISNNTNLTQLGCNDNTNLTYINFKNGNNNNFNTTSYISNFENLPNLQTVCVDELNTDLTYFITTQTGHSVNFATDCSTLNVSKNNILDFSVYPTPTENILNISSKTEIVKIEIYSKLGQLIKETTKNKIDISNLPQGLYFIKVRDINGNFGVKKIMKI